MLCKLKEKKPIVLGNTPGCAFIPGKIFSGSKETIEKIKEYAEKRYNLDFSEMNLYNINNIAIKKLYAGFLHFNSFEDFEKYMES